MVSLFSDRVTSESVTGWERDRQRESEGLRDSVGRDSKQLFLGWIEREIEKEGETDKQTPKKHSTVC